MSPKKSRTGDDNLDKFIAEARREQERRQKSYRERALKIYPWVCARCGREFTGKRLRELTVHHKDHNHDNNPLDGSNWENLCIYCHENEHRRYLDHLESDGIEVGSEQQDTLSHNPFAGLKDLLTDKKS